MKCDFCPREATTTIMNAKATEKYNVCDFCEEEVLLEEIKDNISDLGMIKKTFSHNDTILSLLNEI